MSHWNYRLVRYAEKEYNVHEVHYNDQGLPEFRSWEPIDLFGETKEVVLETLKRVLKDVEEGPVLDNDLFK